MATTHLPTVVIGGGQAGLAMGYHLRRIAHPFVILDADARTGDSWRRRWDSLRLFSLPRYASLPGLAITTPSYPTKDQVADYLEAYAAHFQLPIRHQTAVRKLSHDGTSFVIETDTETMTADRVVIATGSLVRVPRPPFAAELDPSIRQLDAGSYQSPADVAGDVLVVGAGTAGSDIAIEIARTGRRTILAGPHPGEIPLALDSLVVRALMPAVMSANLHVLTLGSPIGRQFHRRLLRRGTPLIRFRRRDIEAAGVERVGFVTGVVDGLPRTETGEVLRPGTVIWCTGFRPDHSWIALPVFGADGQLEHVRGVTPAQSGLYFLGLSYQYSVASAALYGLDRDARHLIREMRKEGPTIPVAWCSRARSRASGEAVRRDAVARELVRTPVAPASVR